MTDRVRRGFVGSADTDHGDRPEMIRGFAFDEDSHPYYIDHEKRAPLPFPCGDKGGFYWGNFSTFMRYKTVHARYRTDGRVS